MNPPDPRIIKFLKEHHVLTLATCVDNKPWCANCYYVFLENEPGFVITSEIESRHIQEALANTNVSGSVLLESDIAGKMQGVQFEGRLKIPDQLLLTKAKVTYIRRFPMISFSQSTLWYLEVTYIKFTDNRLVPVNKIYWRNNSR